MHISLLTQCKMVLSSSVSLTMFGLTQLRCQLKPKVEQPAAKTEGKTVSRAFHVTNDNSLTTAISDGLPARCGRQYPSPPDSRASASNGSSILTLMAWATALSRMPDQKQRFFVTDSKSKVGDQWLLQT